MRGILTRVFQKLKVAMARSGASRRRSNFLAAGNRCASFTRPPPIGFTRLPFHECLDSN
jgi:hypothetical protein